MKPQNEKFAFDAQNELDQNGFWTTKARFARPGIQVYTREEFADWPDANKIEGYYARVLRPESVVFDAEAMKSFENLPLSIEHSSGFVTPDNAKQTVVGAAGSPVTREGDTLTVPITIYDRDAIAGARSGERRELSAGYFLDVEYAPGIDDKYGVYDYVLKSWKGNHITLTRAGKAGPEFYAGDKKMTDKEKGIVEKLMLIRAYDGVEYAFDATSAQVFDKVLGERDAARAELKTAKDAILTDEQIDARVTARVEVAKIFPALDTKGKSMEYLGALLDAAKALPKVEVPETKETNDRAFTGAASDAETGGVNKARADFISKNSGRC